LIHICAHTHTHNTHTHAHTHTHTLIPERAEIRTLACL